ncbi:hypothetical protein [Sphingobium cupriresistens]|nr:hypothetical protein [Sphingobium cupriresistens]
MGENAVMSAINLIKGVSTDHHDQRFLLEDGLIASCWEISVKGYTQGGEVLVSRHGWLEMSWPSDIERIRVAQDIVVTEELAKSPRSLKFNLITDGAIPYGNKLDWIAIVGSETKSAYKIDKEFLFEEKIQDGNHFVCGRIEEMSFDIGMNYKFMIQISSKISNMTILDSDLIAF